MIMPKIMADRAANAAQLQTIPGHLGCCTQPPDHQCKNKTSQHKVGLCRCRYEGHFVYRSKSYVCLGNGHYMLTNAAP